MCVAFGASQQGRPYRDSAEEGRRHRAPAGRAGAVLAPKLGAPLRVDRGSRQRRGEGGAGHIKQCITPPIDISEIDRMHRVGKPEANKSRPVLIKFATYRSKRRFLERRRFLNPAKRTEARQTLRDMIEPQTEDDTRANTIERQDRLYLNDDITRSRAQLLYESRQAKKKQLIADCWSYDGSIIVKTLTNTISTIKTSSDLHSVSMRTIK